MPSIALCRHRTTIVAPGQHGGTAAATKTPKAIGVRKNAFAALLDQDESDDEPSEDEEDEAASGGEAEHDGTPGVEVVAGAAGVLPCKAGGLLETTRKLKVPKALATTRAASLEAAASALVR